MIDGSVLQSAQRCFEKKSRVVVKMVVTTLQIQLENLIYKRITNYTPNPDCEGSGLENVVFRSELAKTLIDCNLIDSGTVR